MTTLHATSGGESLPEAAARRLREVMAGIKLSQKRFGELTGWGRGHVYQRYSGAVPLDIAELECIEETTGIQIDYLLREKGPKYVPPNGPDTGGDQVSERSTVQSCQGAPQGLRPFLRLVQSEAVAQ